jgi:anti-sigma regulatory factor (Ser/Thr protein kinase)
MGSRASAEGAQTCHYSDPRELSDPESFAPGPQFTPAPAMPRDPQARDHGWLGRWPLRSYLELGALDTAPGTARAHVGAVLREWGLGGITDDACLIVSELTTNAVTATRDADSTEPVRIWVLADTGAGVLFLVWDATMPAPVLRVPTLDAEHGRGLTIVEAISARWGSYLAGGQASGKVVWALVRPAPAVRRAPLPPLMNGTRPAARRPVPLHILARVKAGLISLPAPVSPCNGARS